MVCNEVILISQLFHICCIYILFEHSHITGEKSYESKLLKFISPLIFDRSNDFGIYFINVDGQNVKRNNSYCNPYEISVVSFF